MARIISVVTKKIDGTIEVNDGMMDLMDMNCDDFMMTNDEFIRNCNELREDYGLNATTSTSETERAVATIQKELELLGPIPSTVAEEQQEPPSHAEGSMLKALLLKSEVAKEKMKKPKNPVRSKRSKCKATPLPIVSGTPELVTVQEPLIIPEVLPTPVSIPNKPPLSQEAGAAHSKFKVEAEKWRKLVSNDIAQYGLLENELEEKLKSYAEKGKLRRRLMLEMAKDKKEIDELRESLERKRQRLEEKKELVVDFFE